MPFVRLSGTVQGAEDPNRESRARMLYLLFANGWDIYNSNGDQHISLSNIEKKVKESDAFVFMPGATIEDLFKAVSIFVGYQTMDEYLFGKPAVILNSDGSWDGLFKLLDDLQQQGAIRQDFRKYLIETKEPEAVVDALNQIRREGLPDVGRTKITDCPTESFETPPPESLLGSVCVFCSASIEEDDYLDAGYALGQLLAENSIGCVSGAGTTGIMGAVVRGSIEAGGWTAGSNVPHIIELEGLPEGLASFWLRPDIYTRMEVMIEQSDAFIIFPGGAGSVQEMLALLIFKQLGSAMMKGKSVIIYNRPIDGTDKGFWDGLVQLLEPWANDDLFEVIDELPEVVNRMATVLSKESVTG
jgi:uncharacterized protein (TIGR00730 family)